VRNRQDQPDDHHEEQNYQDLADDRPDVSLDRLGVDLHLDVQQDAERQGHPLVVDQHYLARMGCFPDVDRRVVGLASLLRMGYCPGVDHQDVGLVACREPKVELVLQALQVLGFRKQRALATALERFPLARPRRRQLPVPIQPALPEWSLPAPLLQPS